MEVAYYGGGLLGGGLLGRRREAALKRVGLYDRLRTDDGVVRRGSRRVRIARERRFQLRAGGCLLGIRLRGRCHLRRCFRVLRLVALGLVHSGLRRSHWLGLGRRAGAGISRRAAEAYLVGEITKEAARWRIGRRRRHMRGGGGR